MDNALELLGVLVLFGLTVLFIRILAPRDVVEFLFRPRGIDHQDDTRTRADLVRAAIWSFVVSAALLLAMLGAYWVEMRWPANSTRVHIAGIYGFVAFISSAVAALYGVLASWKAIRWSATGAASGLDQPESDA
jgi:hypothetical protein